jgi:hypothetical protein
LRALLGVVVFCGAAGLAAQQSHAAILTLVDDNSSATFDTANPANNFNWLVDGINQLNTQAFWHRIGPAGPEQSVHTLPIGVQGTSDGNFDGNPDTLFVRYLGANYRIETRYTLDGGTPGSGASDMSEQISIINTSANTLDFHFFQYADFDVNGTAGGDAVVFTNPNSVRQFEPGFELTETVVTPVPAHREAAFFNATLVKLNNALPDNLADAPAFGVVLGPGDVTWAYQWDFLLPPNSTFQISKDKNLHANPPIPEPGTGALLAIAAGLFLAGLRKRIS